MHVQEISRNFRGKKVTEIIIQNSQGLEARFCTLGARLSDLSVPTIEGGRERLVLALDDLEDEARYHTYYGATVGRVAGRIAGPAPLVLADETGTGADPVVGTHPATTDTQLSTALPAAGSPDASAPGATAHTAAGLPDATPASGHTVTLTPNEGTTHLHGGPEGLDLAIWDYHVLQEDDSVAVVFALTDPAGHNGYPGTLRAQVTHRLDEANIWTVRYEATTDATTLWNPTNHVYFNLNGDTQATVANHVLELAADAVIPLTAAGLPLGGSWPLADYPLFDFRAPGKALRDGLLQMDAGEERVAPDEAVADHGAGTGAQASAGAHVSGTDPAPSKACAPDRVSADAPNQDAAYHQLAIRGGGYDHAFCLSRPVAVGTARQAAAQGVAPQGQIRLPGTQRAVRVWTDRPCAVIYTHNHQVDGLTLGGQPQVPYAGVSFETQVAPDAPHHPAFGSIQLAPGAPALSETCFAFNW